MYRLFYDSSFVISICLLQSIQKFLYQIIQIFGYSTKHYNEEKSKQNIWPWYFWKKKLKINIRQWFWSKKKLKLFNVLLSFMHTNGDEALRDQDNSKNICFAKVILICFNFDEQRKKWNRCKRKRRYRPWKMKLAKQLGWLLDCDAICLLGFHFQTKTQYVLGIISYWPPTLMKNSFEIFQYYFISIRDE